MFKNKSLVLGIILLIIFTSVITFFISSMIFTGWDRSNAQYGIKFDSGTVSAQNVKKFNQVKNILKKDYYENVDENTLLEGAIAGMADSLKDPYTVYYTKEQMAKITELSQKSEENYSGIGVSITMDNNGLVTIIEPFENSPALNAGILQGDKIIKVNDEDVTDLKDEDAIVKMIKGPENTSVKITVYRSSEGRTIDFNITRKKIKIELNIRSGLLPDNIGYIRIISFMDNNISRIFNEHLKALLTKNIKGLIIDVRDNPGGSLDQVVYIADRLLPEGLIVYTEDKYKHVEERKSDKVELKLPMAVLINGNSASASEILSGAVKDHKRGILIGTKTFGKGLVQELETLNDGSGLKVTISRYYTPSGVGIHGIGIKPDIEVIPAEKYQNMPVSQIPREEDAQLQKAIEVIKGSIE